MFKLFTLTDIMQDMYDYLESLKFIEKIGYGGDNSSINFDRFNEKLRIEIIDGTKMFYVIRDRVTSKSLFSTASVDVVKRYIKGGR